MTTGIKPSFWTDGSGWKMEAEGQNDMKVEIVIKVIVQKVINREMKR